MATGLEDALHVDLETRSTVDLPKTGPYVYFDHWSTECWVACFARGDRPVERWHPGEPPPDTIVKAARDGVPFVAHNAGFERVAFNKLLGPRHGWPCPPLEQWFCTAAMAAALALPRSLDGVCKVLKRVEQKDTEGAALIRKMMKPHRVEQVPCYLCGEKICAHDELFKTVLHYREEPELIERGTRYCMQDVEAERDLCRHLKGLNSSEREIWLLDQLINERGVRIDLPAVSNAQRIVEQAMRELDRAMYEVTSGFLLDEVHENALIEYFAPQMVHWDQLDAPAIQKELANPRLDLRVREALSFRLAQVRNGCRATQAQKLVWWCTAEGVNVKDLMHDTVRDLLLDTPALDAAVRQVLELRQEAAKASTAKLRAYQRRTCSDGRMRDNLLYHGASTGRWSGRGAQLQNLPSRFTLTPEQKLVGAEMIRDGCSAHDLRLVTGQSPLEVISAALRGMIVAGEGKEFTVGDFNAIECRGTVWLAGAKGMLGVFARGEDPYLYQASQTYGHVDLSWVDWNDDKSVEEAKSKYKAERALGKIMVLGLGYGMGAKKFIQTCWKERIAVGDRQAEGLVRSYRESNPEIPELWVELEQAARSAVRTPGSIVKAARGLVHFKCHRSWLYLQLPSGRLLSYAQPRMGWREMPWFDPDTQERAMRYAVIYDGTNSVTHQWGPQGAYGGRWTENVVQALSRDLLAAAMLRLEEAGYRQVLSVHDELVSEHEQGFGSLEEYLEMMTALPAWAEGLPVKAEGWRGTRYRK